MLLCAVGIGSIDVERPVHLAEIIERLAVSRPDGVAVFAGKVGDFLVVVSLLHPYIAGYRRGVVLSPRVFIAFVVVVKHVAIGVKADVLHG